MSDLYVWLRDTAWPLWLQQGIDRPQAAFHECLPNTENFRRLRVVTRQIYVFSAAHHAGLPGAAAAVALGVDFLDRHAALAGGGYGWRFGLDNRVIDDTRDLYDHAFVLLALASAATVLPAAPLRAKALDLLAWLDTHMAHPHGGFIESIPLQPDTARRQNPHMHMLEALLAAHDSFGDTVFRARAADMVALFLDHMVDPVAGALPEYFDEAWRPIMTAEGYVTEPGHHCEWVWLLDQFAGSSRRDPRLAEAAAALMRFVDRFGHAPAGGMADSVSSTGRLIGGGTRLWAQAERLKAEHIRPDATAKRQADAARWLGVFLRPDGLWHERRGADGAFIPGPSPASSLYHLTSAILTLTPTAAPHTSG